MTEQNNNNDGDNHLFELDGEKYNLVKEIEEEVIDEYGNKKIVLIKYVKLNLYEKNKESYKKATKKYIDKNRAEFYEKKNTNTKNRYENDSEFREREKARARENYLKKKQLKNEL